jgi:UDP-2,3-diacylglucosamine pyrophosphatase LpxH
MYLKAAKRLLENNFLIPRKNLVGYSDEDISLSNDKVKGLIMGHCHRPSYNQVNCGKIKKFYANTGAWKHVVMRNKGVNDNEFIKRSTVSYLVIDEYNKNLHAKLSVEEFY